MFDDHEGLAVVVVFSSLKWLKCWTKYVRFFTLKPQHQSRTRKLPLTHKPGKAEAGAAGLGQRVKSLPMARRPWPSPQGTTRPKTGRRPPPQARRRGEGKWRGLKNVSMQQHKEASNAWSSETVSPCVALSMELTCCWPTARNTYPVASPLAH